MFVTALCAAFSVGGLLPVFAFRLGVEYGELHSDVNGVYRAVWEVLHVAPRVAALADTVATLKQQMAKQAAQRLPDRVRDSLRVARWTSP